jgi:uncharacterized protein
MDYFLIPLTALIASFLTFFSGFGLGTLLLPVFALYYPIPVAIALTATVHLLNNIFKLSLVFKSINWNVALKFGIPSLIAAFAGAYVLRSISEADVSVMNYTISGNVFIITWPGMIIGFLIICFSIVELSKKLSEMSFSQKYLFAGGLLSGFFGGLSGHQGALRSAFLLRLNLDKAAFIATGVVVACLVDLVRLSLYSKFDALNKANADYYLLMITVLAAWGGAFVGNKLFRKTSVAFFKWFVGIFMSLMGTLIMLGLIS